MAFNRKEGKLWFIIPRDIDPLLYHIDNFKFIIALILGEILKAISQVRSVASILYLGRL